MLHVSVTDVIYVRQTQGVVKKCDILKKVRGEKCDFLWTIKGKKCDILKKFRGEKCEQYM